MKSSIVYLHQSLHGYDKGHSLISSTVQLSPETKRTLLIMSDMSGPSMQKGFEEYITGYPLRGTNMYALAKTWYAPEMKRPGCVWTHTLLIGFSDLAKLNSYHELISLFRRPEANLDSVGYDKVLEVSIEENYYDSNANFFSSNFNFVNELISNLYGRPNIPVFIKCPNSSLAENLLLSIWFQQWPRLRRNFSFCSGAISSRSIEDKQIDLQVIPYKSENSLKNNLDFALLDFNTVYEQSDQSTWVMKVTEDLFKPSELRFFFRKYGADLKADRSSLKPLAELFILLQHDSFSIVGAVRWLGENYPIAGDGSSLKMSLLNPEVVNLDNSLPRFTEGEILLALSFTEFFESFDYQKLDFKKRFESLYLTDQLAAFQILDQLVNTDVNPYGELALKQIAETIDSNDLVRIEQKYRKNLLLVFASLNPKLSYSKEFWLANKERQVEIISVLLNYSPQQAIDWQRIVNVLIETESSIDPELFETKINIPVLILNWINETDSLKLNYSWQNVLRRKPKAVLEWLEYVKQIKSNTLRTILSVLDPNSSVVMKNGSNVWVRLITDHNVILDKHTSIMLKSFSLALAFNKPDKTSIELLSLCFDSVYVTLKEDSLNYLSWKPIEFHTKPLPFWNDWDKCKKLVNALFDKFPEVKWTRSQVGVITRNSEVAERIISKYNKKN